MHYKIIVISAEKALNTEDRETIENEKDGFQIGAWGFFNYSFYNALQIFMWG